MDDRARADIHDGPAARDGRERDGRPDRAVDRTLTLPGDPLGLGAGPHVACFVDWRALAPEEADRFLVDHLGDDFLDALPDAFWHDDATGRCAWLRADLEPLAIVGDAAMTELGPTWEDALPAAAVLFLDLRDEPPAVVGWDGCPVHGLVPVAPSLVELR